MKGYTKRVLLVFAIISILAFPSFALGAPGDPWPNAWIDSEGNTFYVRRLLYLPFSSSVTDSPIQIDLGFEDQHCWPSTIRIVAYNGTAFNELPYIINSRILYGSGYVSNVTLTFVSLSSIDSHFVYYSDNVSIPFPNYSGKYRTVTGNQIRSFYDDASSSLVSNLTVRMPKNGNGSAEILVPVASAGNFTSIEQSSFNLTALTTFLNSDIFPSVNLPHAFSGMGPNSIKLYRGDTFPSGQNLSEPYLLVGNSYGLSIFRYKNASKTFVNQASVNIPQLGTTNWTIAGLYVSDAHHLGASRLITFGLSNGTIMFYTYDGSSLNYWNRITLYNDTSDLNDPSNPGSWSKPFGIASSRINTENIFQELFIMGQGPQPNNMLAYEIINFNNTNVLQRYNYTSQSIRRSIGVAQNETVNNWSALAYSQMNNTWNQFENFFGSDSYNETIHTYINGNQITIAMPSFSSAWSDGDNSFKVSLDQYRLRDESFRYEVPLVQGIAPGIAYSKKLDQDPSTYKVVSAGVNGSGGNGGLIIRTHRFNNTHTQSGSYLLLQQVDEVFDRSITDYRAFMPVVGNFDGINDTYDDIFVVDNLGYYHYVIFNPTTQRLEKVRSASLFGEYRDLYGAGQSILCYDLNEDGINEILVADSNGSLHVLSAYDPTNVSVFSRYGAGADDYYKQTTIQGKLDYYNREYSISEFQQNISNFIGNNTMVFGGKTYSRYSLRFNSSTEADIRLHSLNITYSTNDYLHLDLNRDLFGLPEDREPNYVDLNGDGLVDFFTRKGIFYWVETEGIFKDLGMSHQSHPTTNVFWNGSWVTLTVRQPYPVGFNYSAFMQSADVDNDGLSNGVEMLLYGTDPFNNDTDNDGLTDGAEVLIHNTLPLNPDTDDDGLTDGEEVLIYFTNPLNNNTNNDWRVVNGILFGLKDGEKVARGLNPLVNDTDGDGIDDMDELGIYAIASSTALKHYSNTQRSLIFYTWDMFYFNILGYTESIIGGIIQLGLDPRKNDTDSDGLSDREEIFGVNKSGRLYTSNPVINDTDGDGLIDGIELYGWGAAVGVRTPGLWITHVSYEYYKAEATNVSRYVVLDPDNWDTDNDKLGDLDELNWGADPTNPDTARDGLLDGDKVNGLIFNGIIYKLNPVLWDNDGDGLGDAEEYYGRFINSDGTNGTFFTYWGHRGGIIQTNPLSKDSDGDGWDDLYELTVTKTNPLKADTSGDGIIDSLSPYPLLHIFFAYFFYYASFIAVGASMVSVVLNQRSLKVLKKRIIQDKDRKQALNRMENERLSAKNFDLKITMIPTENPDLFKVKLTIKILEESFFAKAAKIYYSALDITNQELECTFVGNETFNVTLNDLPVDTQVLFYLSVLNKGGIWVNDDNDGKLYRFTTTKGGKLDTRDEEDWDIKRGVKCQVCGYLCLKEWDECPNCNSPLQSVLQEVLLDEQQKKEEQRKKEQDLDAIAWEDAQVTDDVWRGLPTCPQCGSAVQPDWASCPICSYKLEGVKLEKKALFADEEVDMDYVEGAEEVSEEKYVSDIPEEEQPKSAKQIKEEMEKKKKQDIEKEWGKTDDNVDVL